MRRPLFTPGRRPAAPVVTGAPRAPRIVVPTGNASQALRSQAMGTNPIANSAYGIQQNQAGNVAGIINSGVS